MNFLLGELYASAARSVIEKAGLRPGDIDLIGSHGQTIWHQPEICERDGYPIRYTVQIGEGAVIAGRTGIPTVSDFRVADMAMGGQGAPLVPFSEYLLYRREDETILLQNIGGIGNMTVMPAKAKPEEVYAFDTGPGNMIIDAVTAAVTGGKQTFDEGGRLGGQRHREPEAARLAPAGALLCPAAAQDHGAGAIWDTIYGEDTGLAEDTSYFRRGPGGDGHRSHGLVHRGRLRAVRAGAVPRRRAHRGRGRKL